MAKNVCLEVVPRKWAKCVCPDPSVGAATVVEVVLRNGETQISRAGIFTQQWIQDGGKFDIIWFRVL